MNNKWWLKIFVFCLYICLVVMSYIWDFTVVLMILGIPWSIPLMMFSGLILHITVAGKTILSLGSLIGIMLNLALYYFFIRRK